MGTETRDKTYQVLLVISILVSLLTSVLHFAKDSYGETVKTVSDVAVLQAQYGDMKKKVDDIDRKIDDIWRLFIGKPPAKKP